VIGIGLRIAAARGELWLDEMWSLVLLQQARSFSDIVLSIHHDNNHLLTSAWLWFAGADASSCIVRFPSVVSGSLTLLLLVFGRRYAKDTTVYLVWFLLCCFSYPLVLYSSEARGYALMGFGVALAWSALWMAVEKGGTLPRALTFAVGTALAILAHATALLFLIPVTVWCLVGCALKRVRMPSRGWLSLALLPPYTLALTLWILHYRLLERGGGPILPGWQVLLSTVSTAFGGEELSAHVVGTTGVAALLGCAVLVTAMLELVRWMREGDPWAWLVTTIFLTALFVVGVSGSEFLAPRYLLVPLVPMYYLIARFLVRLVRQGFVGRIVSLALLGIFLTSSTNHIWELITLGRSHFVEMFTEIQREDQGAQVGGDQDFRNSIRLRYVQLLRPQVGSLVYQTDYRVHTKESAPTPDVIIREGSDRYEELPKEFSLLSGELYHLVREYRAPLLSGSRCGFYLRNRRF
jgi:hypothetical protein